MNKLDLLFSRKASNILNMYCTAGYPQLESTIPVMRALQEFGADIIEIGIPYSDPIADGPTIQESNMAALQNGISITALFEQLSTADPRIDIPMVLMGYLNPVLQYGMEKFCEMAEACGISGIILPDLPMNEFEKEYQPLFKKHGLHFIFLVTPETSEARIRKADKLSKGFLYAVSSSSTTGNNAGLETQEPYFKKLKSMKLKNPVLLGFGIKDRDTFNAASAHFNGGIIGSAYIKALGSNQDIRSVTKEFIDSVR